MKKFILIAIAALMTVGTVLTSCDTSNKIVDTEDFEKHEGGGF